MNIAIHRDAPVATLTLNKPDRRNALSIEMMQELTATLEATSADPEINAIILAAEGPAFSAGHDLREMTCGGDVAHYRRVFDVCTELLDTVQKVRQPVIAQIDVIATAAGCQLVATCDLALASNESKFATPGVKIGLFCSTPMVAVSRAIGRKRAMEMLLTGDLISAEDAVRFGLINRVVAADALQAAGNTLARKIAEKSSYTVGLGKKAFYEQLKMPITDAYAHCCEIMTDNMLAPDAVEGIDAFLQKRSPKWPND